MDVSNMSLDNAVSEIFNTPKKHSYIRKNINKQNAKGETQLHTTCLRVCIANINMVYLYYNLFFS